MKTADVINILEQEFNLNEKITPEKISEKLNTDDDETNEIINTLINENILKTSRKGHYTLNVHKIILYKQKHNLSKNKIKTINNIKQEKTKPQEDKKKANNIQPIKKSLENRRFTPGDKKFHKRRTNNTATTSKERRHEYRNIQPIPWI